MALILDTHVVIWWMTGASRLSGALRDRLTADAGHLHVSVASIWENEIKRASGKISAEANLTTAIEIMGLDCIPIVAADARRAANLPLFHRDPFDRMIVAHALNHGLTIVTHDRAFEKYSADIIWA